MRKSLQALMMTLVASSLMPLAARPHTQHNHGKKVVIVHHHGHGHHHGCKPYKFKHVYHKTCRPRRPLCPIYARPVMHHYENAWASDVQVIKPRPRVKVVFNF